MATLDLFVLPVLTVATIVSVRRYQEIAASVLLDTMAVPAIKPVRRTAMETHVLNIAGFALVGLHIIQYSRHNVFLGFMGVRATGRVQIIVKTTCVFKATGYVHVCYIKLDRVKGPECDAGYHGEQCDESCPSNCKDNICNRDDGRCIGCAIEYHGNNCSLKCPDNCMDHTCAQENGECIGCIPGFHGRRCLEKCGYCQDGRCEQDTGNCITPCVDGLTGDRCDVRVVVVNLPCHEEGLKMAAIGVSTGCGVVIVVLIIVIIVLVRRQQSMTQQNTTRSTTMTDISLPNIGQDQRTETGNEAIGAQIKEEIKTKMIQTDDKYESLGQSVKEAPAQNIYEII